MTDELLNQILAWRKELERDPAKRTYHRIAEALLKSGRPAAALDIADKGLFIHEDKYLACQEAKGAALLDLGRYAKAAEVFEEITKQVSNPLVKRKLAMALFGAKQTDRAQKLCREILSANPLDIEAKRLLARGAELLPPPIVDEEPLPEFDEFFKTHEHENTHESESAPSIEQADTEPDESETEERETDISGSEPVDVFADEQAIEEPMDIAEPEPVDVFAEEQPTDEAAETDEPIDVVAAIEQKPTAVMDYPQTEHVQLYEEHAASGEAPVEEATASYRSDEEERPFDSSAHEEANAALDRFFDDIKARKAEPKGDGEAFTPPVEEEIAAEHFDVEEAAEYDPTEGMEEAVLIEDVDVFGDLGGGSKRAKAQQPLLSVITTAEEGDGQANEIPVVSEEERPPVEAEQAPVKAVKKPGRLRRLFGGWRKRKEEA